MKKREERGIEREKKGREIVAFFSENDKSVYI